MIWKSLLKEWEKFNEASFPKKGDFHSNLNMEDIIGSDSYHVQRVYKDFKIKCMGEYHDLHLKTNTLRLTAVFENFRKMCRGIYEHAPAKFLSALGLAWQATLKKIRLELELLANMDMLLMVEKGIRRGICHSINPHMHEMFLQFYRMKWVPRDLQRKYSIN